MTPTLMVNSPPFQQGLQQQPPVPVSQTNQQNNYHARPQQFNHNSSPWVSPLLTPPQQFNTHIPQPFNPQVPPPYFPQYPPSNSPSAGSNDSSVLVALQKQWKKQERLDRERNEMERQKEERKRMKEEREQRKEEWKQVEKCKNQQQNCINKAFEKIPRFDGTNPSYCFDWLEQRHWSMNTKEESIEKNCYSTAIPVYPRPSMH